MIINENCEQRGWCHMPSSRKVEKRIEELGGRNILDLFFFQPRRSVFGEKENWLGLSLSAIFLLSKLNLRF